MTVEHLENLGEELGRMSSMLLASGFLANDEHHAVYERVVKHFQALDKAIRNTRLSTIPSHRMLCDLLAVVHRDGGHYTGEHGLEKSWRDAMQLSSDRIATIPSPDLPQGERQRRREWASDLTAWLTHRLDLEGPGSLAITQEIEARLSTLSTPSPDKLRIAAQRVHDLATNDAIATGGGKNIWGLAVRELGEALSPTTEGEKPQ